MIGGFVGGAAVLLTGMLQKSFGIAYLIRWFAIAAAIAATVLAVVVRAYFRDDRGRIAIADSRLHID